MIDPKCQHKVRCIAEAYYNTANGQIRANNVPKKGEIYTIIIAIEHDGKILYALEEFGPDIAFESTSFEDCLKVVK